LSTHLVAPSDFGNQKRRNSSQLQTPDSLNRTAIAKAGASHDALNVTSFSSEVPASSASDFRVFIRLPLTRLAHLLLILRY
jgi:hypothetical protein